MGLNGVYHSTEITKTSVHDVHYLVNVRHYDLQDCLVLADRGYLSAQGQLDLFWQTVIDLKTPDANKPKGLPVLASSQKIPTEDKYCIFTI